MVTATRTDHVLTDAASRRSHGDGCIKPTRGNMTCGQRNCCKNRFAESAQGMGEELGRQMLTTLSTTRVTGKSSAIEATWKAFVTVAIAAKRRRNCTKIGKILCAIKWLRVDRLGRSGASHSRRAGISSGIPPAQKSLKLRRGNREPSLAREFFPTEDFGRWARCAGSTKQRPV